MEQDQCSNNQNLSGENDSIEQGYCSNNQNLKWRKRHSNMTSFKRFESKPMVKIIFIYDRLRHRQTWSVLYQRLFHDTPLLKVNNDNYAIHKITKLKFVYWKSAQALQKTDREYKPTSIAKIPNNIQYSCSSLGLKITQIKILRNVFDDFGT